MRNIGVVLLLAFTSSAFCGCYKPPAIPDSRYEFVRTFDKLGSEPTALFQSKDGFLYGTFKNGGKKWEGAVFKMQPDGTGFEVLHHFTGYRAGEDGSWPVGLIEGTDGNLYGVTQLGGPPVGQLHVSGGGTIFRVSKEGSNYAVLHRFAGGAGGIEPWGGLAQGGDGTLYGTTLEGGKHEGGTVFKLKSDGSAFAIIHHFAGGDDDGARPMAELTIGCDGVLYGATDSGGKTSGRNGTVFRMNSDGSEFKVLHHFPSGKDDGRMPRGRLIEAHDGILYGTTQSGGEHDGGTVFRIKKDGSGYRVMHEFNSDADGMGPNGLALRADGTLFGTTEHRGIHGHGTLFSLNIKGTGFAVLHPFGVDQNEGANPSGELLLTSDGTLLGMTMRSQPENSATFFNVTFHDQE